MPILENGSFVFPINWVAELAKRLHDIRAERKGQIDRIADEFGDPLSLVKNYVEPDCQQFNPADMDDEGATVVREPIFSRLRALISAANPTSARILLILSDAGMGKTSALTMFKLSHLLSFWPQDYECILLKLGRKTLDHMQTLPNKQRTVLLLDALDEDPEAWDRLDGRRREILNEGHAFRIV